MDGLEVADADLIVYIHPANSNKIMDTVIRQLNSQLFMYDKKMEGVLLAYEVRVKGEHAKLLPGLHPYLAVDLKATMLMFCPEPHMQLEGKVVKVKKGCIHAIVLGFCSATIMTEDIRDEFKFKAKHGGVFVSNSNRRHIIKVGTFIRFSVKSFDEEMLHICGSLSLPDTGCIRWLTKHAAEEESPEVDSRIKSKKRKINEAAHEQGPTDSDAADRTPPMPNRPLKRPKTEPR